MSDVFIDFYGPEPCPHCGGDHAPGEPPMLPEREALPGEVLPPVPECAFGPDAVKMGDDY